MTRICYDAIHPEDLPPGAPLYLGYVGGQWPTYPVVVALFPQAKVVPVAINAQETATMLDVEKGDAGPADAPAWAQRMRALGIDPTVYCSLSSWLAVEQAFIAQGVPQPHYFIAHQTSNTVIPVGAVGLQWGFAGLYDQSLVADYWPGVDPPPVAPEEDDMQFIVDSTTTVEQFIVASDLTSKAGLASPEDLAALLATGQFVRVTLSTAQLASIPTVVS